MKVSMRHDLAECWRVITHIAAFSLKPKYTTNMMGKTTIVDQKNPARPPFVSASEHKNTIFCHETTTRVAKPTTPFILKSWRRGAASGALLPISAIRFSSEPPLLLRVDSSMVST